MPIANRNTILSPFVHAPCIALIVGLLLLGCRSSRSTGNTASAKQAGYTGEVLHRQDSTRHYTYDIRLPDIIHDHAVLRDTLLTLADHMQDTFVFNAERDTASQTPPWELLVKIAVHDSTQNVISVRGSGYEYTGGAHGMPFYIILNYDQQKERFIELRDMMHDSTDLAPIVEEARIMLATHWLTSNDENGSAPTNDAIRRYIAQDDWLRDGTSPSWTNYSNTLLEKQGLYIIFGAYQVGPYAIGTPEIKVPVSVFRAHLKPRYRRWFAE